MSCGGCLDLAHMVSDVTFAKAVGCLQNKSAVEILWGETSQYTNPLLPKTIHHICVTPGASSCII